MAVNTRNRNVVFERVRDPAYAKIFIDRTNITTFYVYQRNQRGQVTFYPVDKADYLTVELMQGRRAAHLIHGELQPGSINHSRGNGRIDLLAGQLGIAPGRYSARITAFDANNVAGLVLAHEDSEDGITIEAIAATN